MNHARPEETCSPVASRRFIKLAYVAWKLNGNAGSINMVIEILAQILAAPRHAWKTAYGNPLTRAF